MKLVLTAALAFLLGGRASSAEPTPPRLVVFLSIDQGRAEYLERFRPVLEGGLLLLLERGVVFEQTHHAHAVTVTAPGHASLSTGLFPSHSGIVGNDWFDRREKREVYCVEDRSSPLLPVPGVDARHLAALGRSPGRLEGTGLGDWMKRSSRRSRVYSAAGKDRAAVLLGGKKADGAFWFDAGTGHWVTSRYYMEEYPAWALQFHAERRADAYFGSRWEPLPVHEDLLASMRVEESGAGAKDSGIPKVLGRGALAEDSGFYAVLFETPFLETHLLAFAERLVREERLGTDEAPDLLALGLSSVDSVGHDYGPNSRELLDAVMRLDRELGSFFRFLDETVGFSRVALVLSADHGVAALPEYRARYGLPGGRLSPSALACIGRAGKPQWFVAPLHFDDKALAREKLSRKEAEALVAKEISGCPGVARVWTRSEIERVWDATDRADGVDPTLLQFARSYYPGRSPDVFVQLAADFIEDGVGTTHGSPYEYDTHVPGIVLWPGLAGHSVEEPIATVDLPVTVASLLGIRPPADVDGKDRSDFVRQNNRLPLFDLRATRGGERDPYRR